MWKRTPVPENLIRIELIINTYCSYKNDIEVAFVTAFATTKKMLQVYPKIAWDTEIWIAEEATHLTHKNGDRFMGRSPEEFL